MASTPYDPNAYNLPQSALGIIPQALGQDFFSSLDSSLQLQEQQGATELSGLEEQSGMLNSGKHEQDLIQQILGPGLQQRQQALSGLAIGAAQTGEQQQFQASQENTQFQQQQQLQQQQFQDQLALLQQQSVFQQGYLGLQHQLYSSSFGDILGNSFAGSFGTQLGSQAAGNTGQSQNGASGILGGLGGL